MPVTSPPATAIAQNQTSATIKALLSAFTSLASARATSSNTARGAPAAQMSPATTPSSALPASAATNTASRCFVGPPLIAGSLPHDGTGQDRAGSRGDQHVVDTERGQLSEVAEQVGQPRLRCRPRP